MNYLKKLTIIRDKQTEKKEEPPAPTQPTGLFRSHFLQKKYFPIGVAILTVTSVFFASSFLSTAKSLELSNQKLQQISSENSKLTQKTKKLEYENAKLTGLKEQAIELEEKAAQMDKVKEELYEKLDEMTIDNTSVSESIKTSAENTQKTFTSLVYTPYTKSQSLERVLITLENSMDTNAAKLSGAAQTVSTELAGYKIKDGKMIDISQYPSLWPSQGPVSSEYAVRSDPFSGAPTKHMGMDIAVPNGTPVKATAAGRILIAQHSKSFGNFIRIDHGNGYETVYGHNSKLLVSAGDFVGAGEVIAFSGATGYVTGPHVHYEVIFEGEHVNPRDFLP